MMGDDLCHNDTAQSWTSDGLWRCLPSSPIELVALQLHGVEIERWWLAWAVAISLSSATVFVERYQQEGMLERGRRLIDSMIQLNQTIGKAFVFCFLPWRCHRIKNESGIKVSTISKPLFSMTKLSQKNEILGSEENFRYFGSDERTNSCASNIQKSVVSPPNSGPKYTHFKLISA